MSSGSELMYIGRSTRHLRTLKASHLRTLQTSHPRTEKPRHPRTKSGHPRTLMLGTSHFGFGWGGGIIQLRSLLASAI